jgi:ribosomal protein S18 acetylase RimI-like enzyme
MVNLSFVEYDEKYHTEYYRIFHDYLKWHNEQVVKHYGVHFFKNGNINKALERIVPIYTSIKPPEGVILLLTIENKVAGMGRLVKLEEGIGEINNMYVDPIHRGKGYGRLILDRLEKKARAFGFNVLRLDAAGFNVVAQNLYRKTGYYEIEQYYEIDFKGNEDRRLMYDEAVYMEKNL